MRVGIIQSNYIPWKGYFDFIDSVDLFIFHDDVQYTKGDWRNRNKIKTRNGTKWLTVPVHYRHKDQLICDTEIDYSTDWQNSHLNQLTENYAKAPHFEEVIGLMREAFFYPETYLSDLNTKLIDSICKYLGITTRLAFSTDYGLSGHKTERLMQLLTRVGATTYVSGPAAKSYLDEKQFHTNGINLEYMKYDIRPYKQLYGEFNPNVSILDYIACV
jgi:hypothetical protein